MEVPGLPFPTYPGLNAIQGKASGLHVQAQSMHGQDQAPPWPSLDEDAQKAGCGGMWGTQQLRHPVQALNGDSGCLRAPGHPDQV